MRERERESVIFMFEKLKQWRVRNRERKIMKRREIDEREEKHETVRERN